MDLFEEMRATAETDLFGVVDALNYEVKAPAGHCLSDYLRSVRSIVLLGVRLLDAPLDGLASTRKEYTANFHVANSRLNDSLFGSPSCSRNVGMTGLPSLTWKCLGGTWKRDRQRSSGFCVTSLFCHA